MTPVSLVRSTEKTLQHQACPPDELRRLVTQASKNAYAQSSNANQSTQDYLIRMNKIVDEQIKLAMQFPANVCIYLQKSPSDVQSILPLTIQTSWNTTLDTLHKSIASFFQSYNVENDSVKKLVELAKKNGFYFHALNTITIEQLLKEELIDQYNQQAKYSQGTYNNFKFNRGITVKGCVCSESLSF